MPKRALHPCNADVVIAKIHPLIKGNIRFFTRRRVLLIPVHLGALYGERESDVNLFHLTINQDKYKFQSGQIYF